MTEGDWTADERRTKNGLDLCECDSPETSRLDACELDPPLWLDLLADCFREAFYSPFTCAVQTEEGDTLLTANRGDLLDETSAWFLVAQCLHGFASHVE